MSEKLESDVHLIKAVEHLDEELRPFIDAQWEERGVSPDADERADLKPADINLASDRLPPESPASELSTPADLPVEKPEAGA